MNISGRRVQLRVSTRFFGNASGKKLRQSDDETQSAEEQDASDEDENTSEVWHEGMQRGSDERSDDQDHSAVQHVFDAFIAAQTKPVATIAVVTLSPNGGCGGDRDYRQRHARGATKAFGFKRNVVTGEKQSAAFRTFRGRTRLVVEFGPRG